MLFPQSFPAVPVSLGSQQIPTAAAAAAAAATTAAAVAAAAASVVLFLRTEYLPK